jgi:putative transposase
VRLRWGQKTKGRKRHLLVDTEALMLKATVHSANVVDHNRIKPLLGQGQGLFPRLAHLWLNVGYIGARQRQGLGREGVRLNCIGRLAAEEATGYV